MLHHKILNIPKFAYDTVSEPISYTQKDEAEFWAWITEAHAVPESLIQSPEDKTEQGYRVLSADELKQLIANAFDKGNQQLADRLLSIVSQPQQVSDELIRKSLRLKTGEYLKLLYAKLLEKTSFSDILIRILTPKAKAYLESLLSRHPDQLSGNNRLEHLQSLVESWIDMSPDSRSRAVDMGLRDYEGKTDIQPDYPYQLDQIKTSLSDFILNGLEKKLLYVDGPIFRERSRAYEEFRQQWEEELKENPLGEIYLGVAIDPTSVSRLIFQPTCILRSFLTVEQQQDLFEKYGENDINSFLSMFNVSSDLKKINYLGSCTDGGLRDVSFWIEIELPKCGVIIENAESFYPRSILQPEIADNLDRDFDEMMRLTVALGKNLGLDASNYFTKENEHLHNMAKEDNVVNISAITYHVHSRTWNDFLKLATKLSKTPEDFLAIKKINSNRNKILGYGEVQVFVEDMVQASIQRRSVVSFYVSKDVWRFLPWVIKEQDWFAATNEYLNLKND
jgi:predicted CopG family antitoxin